MASRWFAVVGEPFFSVSDPISPVGRLPRAGVRASCCALESVLIENRIRFKAL
jgi:hypothetical protein